MLLGVGVEILLQAIQGGERELRGTHLGQPQQARPVTFHELRRQRLVAVQPGARAARALLHDLEADLVASRNFSGECRAGRCGKRVQRGVELARLHGGRFVRGDDRPPGAAAIAGGVGAIAGGVAVERAARGARRGVSHKRARDARKARASLQPPATAG